jgi:hypothetical protein
MDFSDGGFDDNKSIIVPLHEEFINRPRSVSFNSTVLVYDVLCIDDYSPEEFEATWFDEDEMREMKETAQTEAKLLDAGFQQKCPCIRGLESRTREGLMTKRQNRMNAYASIFFEIDSQQENKCYDEDLIAEAYAFYSEPCARTAQIIGKQDEFEAKILNQCNSKFSQRSFRKSVGEKSRRMRVATSAA